LYNHYSLLKTIESSWGLPAMTANDTSASAMNDFFANTSSTGAPQVHVAGSEIILARQRRPITSQ
jgi:hypothetical protein